MIFSKCEHYFYSYINNYYLTLIKNKTFIQLVIYKIYFNLTFIWYYLFILDKN